MGNKIALVDDHPMWRQGVADMIKNAGLGQVICQAGNGIELMEAMQNPEMHADIVLLDVNMPRMDGKQTCSWLNHNHPHIKVLGLTMLDDDESIMDMIRRGACGYVAKDAGFDELSTAINSVFFLGHYYNPQTVQIMLANANIEPKAKKDKLPEFSEREKEFIRLSCSDLPYKEVAELMNISLKSIDNYRETLFEKCKVKSRVGLAMFAIQHGIVVLQ